MASTARTNVQQNFEYALSMLGEAMTLSADGTTVTTKMARNNAVVLLGTSIAAAETHVLPVHPGITKIVGEPRALRPDATTGIPNLFLASDYVRTYTDLATMEGANEAARRAVNGLLDAVNFGGSRCELWPLHEPEIPVRKSPPQRLAPGTSVRCWP